MGFLLMLMPAVVMGGFLLILRTKFSKEVLFGDMNYRTSTGFDLFLCRACCFWLVRGIPFFSCLATNQ